MRNKAPDTRNKLDSNRDLNKKPRVIIKKGDEKPKDKVVPKSNKRTLKELRVVHTPEVIKLKLTPKKTNGQLFKEANGYSKSMKRAMNNNDVTTLEAYRKIRITKKKAVKKIQHDKHTLSKAKRMASTGVKKTGKKKK